MKIKSKIIIVVAITALVIVGLFILKAYYGNKLGIFADALRDEQIISSKDVSTDDFADYDIDNLERNGDVLQIQSEPRQVCGGGQDSVTIDSVPSTATMRIQTTEVTESNESSLQSYDQNYYIGDELIQTSDYTASLRPTTDNPDNTISEMLVSRGPGWVEFRLLDGNIIERKAFAGSVTFSSEISLNANSLSYTLGGNGMENPADGTTDLTSSNDEVTLDVDNKKVTFHMVTSTAYDTFRINYCFYESTTITGSVAGTIDLGEPKPLTNMQLRTENYDADRDGIRISSEISNDGVNWVAGREVNGRKFNYQDSTPVDNYCFRYIRFTITMTSESTTSSVLGLIGLDVYGGDTCGAAIGFDPGGVSNLVTACSNGIDDDGDGKVDFSASGDGDPGCTNYMDDGEENAEKVCLNGDGENINLVINIVEHQDGDQNDLGGNIYVGAETEPVESGAIIPLVADGVAIKDQGIQDAVTGLSVYRGEGYFYLHNQTEGVGREAIRGDFQIDGANITKAINRNYDQQGNGVGDFGNPDDDEYSVLEPDNLNSGQFVTTTSTGSDGVYIYYDYQPQIGGGCQCQDGVDNDGNGRIDFPNDMGCSSVLDDEEEPSDYQMVSYPACSNGLDDDKDGSVDYPEDSSCESLIDNSEEESVKVCSLDDANISMSFSDVEVSNTDQGDMQDLYFAGNQVYKSNENIPLISSGVSQTDENINRNVPGVSVKRGPGYVYLLFLNDTNARGYEYFHGKLTFQGAKITKALNGVSRLSGLSPLFIGGAFESQGDNISDNTGRDSWQDEFTVYNAGEDNYVEITSTTGNGSDSLYIYYDYVDATTGGCQCQDGLDNDGDGLVDYPSDQGCSSLIDDNETDSIINLISEPSKIVPALVSSGPGFWILIIIVLVISGVVTYLIIRADKNKV